jgi:hypothetical protein
LLEIAETGSLGLDFVRGSPGGVVASNAARFSSLGFVGLDDVAMDIPGVFSVINGLGDVSTVAGGCCGRCRGSVWAAALVVVGLDSFLGSRDAPSDGSRDTPSNGLRDTPSDSSRDTPSDSSRDTPSDGSSSWQCS